MSTIGKADHAILTHGKTVTVYISREIGFSLEKIQKIQQDLVTRLGHTNCYSGFDILFKQEEIYSVDAKSLELNPVHGFGG